MTDEELIASLAALPAELPPPPHLEGRVLRQPDRRSVRWIWPLAMGCALVAMVAVVLGGMWSGAKELRIDLVQGTQLVQGDGVELWLGDTRVRVDGRARIDVEPSEWSARRGGAEDPMVTKSLIAAAVGAAITVTVYEGAAYVYPDGQPPIPVLAGSTHHSGGAGVKPRDAAPLANPVPPPSGLGSLTPEQGAYVQSLEQENESLKFQNQLLNGQVEVAAGRPLEWPTSLAPGLAPERFEENMRRAVQDVDGVDFLRVDCTEYPCVALVTVPVEGGMGVLHERLGSLSGRMSETLGIDELALSTSVAVDGDDPIAVAILAPMEGDEPDAEVTERLSERLRLLSADVRDSQVGGDP